MDSMQYAELGNILFSVRAKATNLKRILSQLSYFIKIYFAVEAVERFYANRRINAIALVFSHGYFFAECMTFRMNFISTTYETQI